MEKKFSVKFPEKSGYILKGCRFFRKFCKMLFHSLLVVSGNSKPEFFIEWKAPSISKAVCSLLFSLTTLLKDYLFICPFFFQFHAIPLFLFCSAHVSLGFVLKTKTSRCGMRTGGREVTSIWSTPIIGTWCCTEHI